MGHDGAEKVGTSEEVPEIHAGDLIGAYRIVGKIKEGGMGTVYRATHWLLGRPAAVKVLSPRLALQRDYVSRFFNEARIVNDARHPNIVDIFDFIISDRPRRVAYVMELLDGPPLNRIAAPLTARQVFNTILQLADALGVVHELGVVHRDLKPDNVIIVGPLGTDLSARPAVKILDFGVAKVTGRDVEHQTAKGIMLGTPAYMAPEQLIGVAVSAKTDVYALGEILFEILMGKPLFTVTRNELLAAKLSTAPMVLELRPDLPFLADIHDLLQACLALDPDLRPTTSEIASTMRELIHALDRGG